ncbi:MAG: SDR family NAD(P)-dependent oxidoreductase [Putridiphycobacter sp.]|nr:SDR family NAD(P)-dependent oxidoreductase [Putridiphycobacter sp.]
MANIIIIGASTGIGYEIVKQLAPHHQVLALSRRTDSLAELSLENLTFKKFDLTSSTAKKDILNIVSSHFKTVDFLINNAGYLVNAPLLELTETDIDKMFQTNVTGIIKTCQAIIPLMSSGAHIVNIGSMGGFQGSAKFVGLSAYSASKAAIASFTECLAEEIKPLGISANCLALGAAQTDMLANAFPGYEAPVSAEKMAEFICQFSLTAHQWINGKVVPISLSTP